jgi:hypothetical protein
MADNTLFCQGWIDTAISAFFDLWKQQTRCDFHKPVLKIEAACFQTASLLFRMNLVKSDPRLEAETSLHLSSMVFILQSHYRQTPPAIAGILHNASYNNFLRQG